MPYIIDNITADTINVDSISTDSLSINGTEINNGTTHYELDITQTNVVTVNTTKGIIDILGMGTDPGLTPAPLFDSSTQFYINNPDLDLTVGNRDNVYVQYSLYYNQTFNDFAIPYLISTGFITQGLGFNLYDAQPGTALLPNNSWQGALYVYYELYTIN